VEGPRARRHAAGRRARGAARNENAAIARQLIRDRDAGVPGAMWIKYINWTDESGVCRQERWMDLSAPLRRTTRTSTDNGHIHISGRSDVDDDDRADTYDPIARMTGTDERHGRQPGAAARERARVAAELPSGQRHRHLAALDRRAAEDGAERRCPRSASCS
jgi:hypothetical protein